MELFGYPAFLVVEVDGELVPVENCLTREWDALVLNPEAVLGAIRNAEMRKLVSW